MTVTGTDPLLAPVPCPAVERRACCRRASGPRAPPPGSRQRPPGPRARRRDRRAGGRGGGLHAEPLRGRAGAPVTGQPPGHRRRTAATAGWRRSSRRAAARTRPPARPATRTRRRSARRSRRRWGRTPPGCSTCPPGSSARGCRSTGSLPRIAEVVADELSPTDDGARGRRGRPSDDRFGDEGRHDARPRVTAEDGEPVHHGHGGREGRRDDPPERMATMLSIVLTDAGAAARDPPRDPAGAAVRTWNQLTVDGDTSTNDTVFLLASVPLPSPSAASPRGARRSGRRRGRRPGPRPPAGRGRRGRHDAHHLPGHRRRDDADARAVARAVIASQPREGRRPRPRPELGPDRRRRGQRASSPSAAVLEAGGAPRTMPGSAPAPRPPWTRSSSGSRSRATSSTTAPTAARSPSTRRPPAPRWTGDEVLLRLDLGLGDGTGEAFGCDLTEAYVRENAEYTT
jgi:hypothetical protein